ncbi:hypothetical protein BKA82DRAFT_4014790 [Pisolithus tinctorius]|nr:hypothetical protein BKA82DRAFT_4014790 [Pisolithus tinctorius]
MPEWCPWKAAVERVLGIPHPLNTNGQKAGNSLINGTYIPGAACEVWVTQISSNSCRNGVHGRPLLTCEVWVTQISSDSCQNGVDGKLLFSGCWGYHIHSIQMGRRLEILRFMLEWFPWKATVEQVLRIPHPLNPDGQKAGNSLINGTYIRHAACEVWDTQISSNSCQNGVDGKLLFSGCWGYHIRSIQMGGRLAILQFMPEWCPWKATVEWVPRIPHPPNSDGQKAGNSLINGTYIPEWCPWKATVEQVLGIPHLLNADGQKAGNSLINGTYIPGAACELQFMPEWFPWKAAVQRVLRIPHPLNTDVWKAGNSVINGTYTPGAASTVEGVPGMPHLLNADGWMAGNSVINAKYTKGAACELQFMPEWFPWKATVERVPGMLHPLNTDGRMAGNSVINAKYTKGAACDVWVTQISSDSFQNGVHGKPILGGCWGCHIRSMWMGGWLAIVRFMPNTSRLQLVRSGSLKSSAIHASMVSIESCCSVGARDTTSISDRPVFMFQQGTSYWGWACPYAVII